MKTKIQLFAAFLLMAVGALWLSSCSSEDAVQGSGNTESERVLLLTISTGQTIGSRAETDLTDAEKTIEDMTIGIFDANGNVRTIQSLEKKDASATTATAGDGKFVISGTKAEAKIVTTGLKAGDNVVVAVNTKLNSANAATFKAAKSVADFNKGYIDATSALTAASDGTTLSAAKLPKYGEATLVPAGSNSSEFSADVKVKNLVSRVTLASYNTDIADGPYAGASFTLSDIFLLNVPNTVDFSTNAWTAQPVSYIHGSDVDGTGYTAATAKKAFLVKSPAAVNDYLYTLPNQYTGLKPQKTILVLKGKFKKADGETGTDVYYPLALNATYDNTGNATAVDGDKPFVTYPGRNYKCNVTIKTIGSDSPWQEAGPLTATVDVEVEKWTDVDQTTYFK